MDKQPCELVQDILPLYVEESVSETTRAIVEAHLQECPECRELCAELKREEPVWPELEESLPEADTFKKWAKRLKITAIIALVFIILAGVGIGVLSFEAGSSVNHDLLTVKDVTKTLKQAGLKLTSSPDVNPAAYKMGQVEPSVYQLKELGGTLFIYQFASIGERNTAYQEWDEALRNKNPNSFDNMFTPQWQYQLAFAAKNTILIVGLPQFPSEKDAEKMSPVLLNIAKTVFYKLNDGEQIVYQGEGENWTGKVIIYYYNHFWTDEKGVSRYDGWSHKQPVLSFKGDTAAIQGEFSCEFDYPLGKSGYNSDNGFEPGQFAERERIYNYGGSALSMAGIGGDGGFVPQSGTVCTVKVKWNNQEETMELKANN